MEIPNLNLESGTWLVANCATMEGHEECHMVMMAPESQREALLDTVIAHHVKAHGAEDSSNLRKQVGYHVLKEVDL